MELASRHMLPSALKEADRLLDGRSLAMVANLLFAGILGTIIPLTLEKFKIDPAISSSVFLTTATDVIGFFTFLGLSAIIIL